jgi:hypothetical protein
MVEIVKRDNKEYVVLERDERNHVYEFAILKNLKKDYERTVIPKEEVLAIIAEFTNERNIRHRYSLRWGWGSIIGRIEKDRDGDEWVVMYYVPCEKQFAEYCEAKKEMVYLGEDLYYEPDYSYAVDIPTHIIYCDTSWTVWIIHTTYSEKFATKLEEELRKDPELMRQLLNNTKVREIYTVNVSRDIGFEIYKTLTKMVEKGWGCIKIEIPDDIAKKIAETMKEKTA